MVCKKFGEKKTKHQVHEKMNNRDEERQNKKKRGL